jgi:hypothetical protein
VEVSIPVSKLKDMSNDRDVLKHNGPVKLDRYNWTVHSVDDDN